MVHHPAKAVAPRHLEVVSHRAALVVVVAGVVAGCGGDGDGSSAPEVPGQSGEVALNAREADCTDWNEASVEQRGALIDALEEAEGAPTTGGTPAVLPEDQAYDLLENYCSQSFARAFKLYKLYARAAAFQASP
jgi:hypothetical protein